MLVREIMANRLVYATPDATLQDVARQMAEHDCGEIPIVESAQSHKLVGVITDRDIVCRAVAQGRNPLELRAKECMSSPVITASADANLDEVCQLMEQNQIRRVPVIDAAGRVLVGMVAQADIARVGTDKRAGQVLKEVSRHAASPSAVGH